MEETEEKDIVIRLAELFQKHQVPYFLTGGFAVSYWGRPRATHDIDFVVEIEIADSKRLFTVLKKLGRGYFIDWGQVERAIKQHSQFNILHSGIGLKIDFWIGKSTAFEKEKFQRRIFVSLFGEKIALITAEDLILTKLLWCRPVFSDRHFDDCVSLYQAQKGNLDENYLLRTAQELRIAELLKKILQTPVPPVR